MGSPLEIAGRSPKSPSMRRKDVASLVAVLICFATASFSMELEDVVVDVTPDSPQPLEASNVTDQEIKGGENCYIAGVQAMQKCQLNALWKRFVGDVCESKRKKAEH